MNAQTQVTTVDRVSPIERYRQEVLPPDKASDLYRSLPTHITPARFERNLVNALMQNPDLLKFDPRLVYREVCKAAALGLLLDPQLGEGYMVVAYNYKTKQQEPQLRVGYKGWCKLARQAGDVTGIYAHEVCQNDHIACQLGTEKRLEHTPNLFGDRGPVIGYYAVIKFKDDLFDFEPMTLSQVNAIRDRSDAWKAFTDGKIKSTPWSTDPDEMAKKTVLRRLLKRQPQSPDLSEAIKIEDEAEFPSMRGAREIVAPPSPPKLAAPSPQLPDYDPNTGVMWADPPATAQASPPSPPSPQQGQSRPGVAASAAAAKAVPSAQSSSNDPRSGAADAGELPGFIDRRPPQERGLPSDDGDPDFDGEDWIVQLDGAFSGIDLSGTTDEDRRAATEEVRRIEEQYIKPHVLRASKLHRQKAQKMLTKFAMLAGGYSVLDAG